MLNVLHLPFHIHSSSFLTQIYVQEPDLFDLYPLSSFVLWLSVECCQWSTWPGDGKEPSGCVFHPTLAGSDLQVATSLTTTALYWAVSPTHMFYSVLPRAATVLPSLGW